MGLYRPMEKVDKLEFLSFAAYLQVSAPGARNKLSTALIAGGQMCLYLVQQLYKFVNQSISKDVFRLEE